jgi:hypothetical protein
MLTVALSKGGDYAELFFDAPPWTGAPRANIVSIEHDREFPVWS